MNRKLTLFNITVGFFPYFAFAQTTFKTLAGIIIDILNASVGLIVGMSLLAFIIGMVRFIATAGDDKSRVEGKQMMVWGIVSLFVMFAVWGIVDIIGTTFFGS